MTMQDETMQDEMTADGIARRATEALWAEDNASQGLGMKLVSVGPGRAVIAMTVTAAMTNGHGTCHGGYIFTLADSAFAFACNSVRQRSVAQQCQITYISPAREGMRLTAEGVERQRSERSGITDVTVRDESGNIIAEFRGHSRTVAGTLF
jgi:acyl-CoA thioesterase